MIKTAAMIGTNTKCCMDVTSVSFVYVPTVIPRVHGVNTIHKYFIIYFQCVCCGIGIKSHKTWQRVQRVQRV